MLRFSANKILALILTFSISACASSPKTPENEPILTVEKPALSEEPEATLPIVLESVEPDIFLAPLPVISAESVIEPLDDTKNKIYPTLVYGQPLPFVCPAPVLQEGKLANRPNLQLMWENFIHDRPHGVWHEIGGLVEYNGELAEDLGGWRNACAVRMSYMLNKAGLNIPYIEEKTVSGNDGQFHFFRLDDLVDYLTHNFGKSDFEYNHGPSRWQELPNKPGLLVQRFPGSNFTGHATIWNGAGSVDDSDIGGYQILFWELPCFLPPERTP